jgi:DNA-directed RNA polymerase specialized sigma24 family protein
MVAAKNVVDIPECARGIIYYKSRQLIGSYGFTISDLDDIRQELAVDLWLRLPGFDPTRASLRTFVTRVVSNKIASIIEMRTSKTRNVAMCPYSLNDLVYADDGSVVERGDLLGGIDAELELADLRMDVARVMKKLTPAQRQVCALLSTDNKSLAAAATGVSRSSMYRAVKAIRPVFEADGLGVYAEHCT